MDGVGAGEAASLFGAADSAGDLFPVAGGDGSDTPMQPGSHGPSHAESPTASDLFNTASDSTDFFAAAGIVTGASDEHAAHSSWPQAGQENEFIQGAEGAISTVTSDMYHSEQRQANGWYNGDSHVSTYEQPDMQTATAYGSYSQSQTGSTASYDPYAPTTLSASHPTASSVQNTPSAPYDPYTPPNGAISTTYASSQSTYTAQAPYDPYKPSQLSVPKVDAVFASSHASGTPATRTTYPLVTSLPAPPAPASRPTPSYRPKTFNAYDPPLPPPKQPRHGSARQASYASSPPPVQQLLVGESAQSPLRKPPLKNVDRHIPIATSQGNGYVSSAPYEKATSIGHDETHSVFENDGHIAAASKYGHVVGANGHSQYSSSSSTGSHSIHQSTVPELYAPIMSPNSTLSSLPSANGYGMPASPRTSGEQLWTESDPEQDPVTPHVVSNNNLNDVSMFSKSVSPPPRVPEVSQQYGSIYEPPPASKPPVRAMSPSVVASVSEIPPNALSTSHYHNSHSPPDPTQSVERTQSPGNAPRSSWSREHSQVSEPSYSGSAPASLPKPSNVLPSTYSRPNSYEPPVYSDAKRAASPASTSSRKDSVNGAHDPYAPSTQNRNRSMSSNSVYSSISSVLEDPYVPTHRPRQQPSESSSRGSIFGPYDHASMNGIQTSRYTTGQETGGQVLTIPPAQTIYAPSPSLLGANDPLGRTSVRVPVISFGFGGKLVTCFHGASDLDTGFDVALASRQSRDIKVYILHKVIPESTMDTSAASYPGPLFSDPGTPSTSLVRTGTAVQTKTKKARLIKYLDERAEEISRGIGYFHQSSLDGKRAEAKHVLVKILKVMVENDGHLSGSSQIDVAVRAALVPRLANSSSDPLQNSSSLSASQPVDLQSPRIPVASPFLGVAPQDPNDTPVAVHTVRSSNLDKIQEFLLRGDRRAACHYALDEKLWAHAMVIASSIDKEAWKEVVTEFVRSELAGKDGRRNVGSLMSGEEPTPLSDGREALRVAYSLFAGQGPASVKELVPPQPPGQSAATLQIPSTSVSSITPLSASFPVASEPMNIPPETLAKWADTVAMFFVSPVTLEVSSALTALGDQLAANQWYEAAHVCYLLSPQTSPMGGVGSSSRVVLLGSQNPSVTRNFASDPDPIIFSEIVEFALSLATPAKGQETFAGLPYLQPYRLIRAATLAEMGHVQLAHRYCEAISSCISRNSPYITPTFLEQLKGLSDQLVAAPQMDKSGSWIGSKVAKPSLDSIGNWLEGRLTKFIAGDVDSPRPEEAIQMQQQQASSGPFAHYSTISSAASSAIPSPQQSKVDLVEMPNSPPLRTGSAMALRSSAAPQVQINRSSSAMDYVRPPFNRKASPVPRVSSASAAQTTFSDTSLYSQALNGHAFGSSSKQSLNDLRVGEDRPAEDESQSGPQSGAWWGSPDSEAPTPTASSFTRIDDGIAASSSSGFISLMDDPAYSTTPTASGYGRHESVADEEDDLGLGNSSSRAKRRSSDDEQEMEKSSSKEEQKEEQKPAAAQKPELKSASSGSWISRLWKRDSTPAPVKANLGEQTTFYYDKDLKRWVNKTAGPDAAKPSQPPPPPRAQTASPGRSLGAVATGTPPPPPPARPATVNPMDASGGPPRPIMRVRSNLVPAESENGSAPPTPLSATMLPPPGAGPPPTGTRSRAQAKRPVRNRYVDVFQQPAGGN